MKIIKLQNSRLAFFATAVLVFASALSAQEPETPERPKPAGRGIPAMDDTAAEDQNKDPLGGWNADTTPLTGMQTPTIGSPNLRHSYWVPGFQYSNSIQDQPSGTGSSGGWNTNNYFGGNLSMVQQLSHSQLGLNFSAGGFVTNQQGQKNGWYQQLAFSELFSWRRWQMQILDQFSYLPESQFGFGGGTGLGAPGVGGSLGPGIPGVGGTVSPNQSIYAAVGPRYSNSLVTQVTYQTSPRGSITMSGSYGLLHFTQSGNVDTDTYYGSVGYNYQLTKQDSIGLFYRFAAFHYQSQPQALGDHVVNAAYSRKITKRLAFQVFGGPDLTLYRVPIGNQSQTVSASGGMNLSSAFQNGSLSLSYFHARSGGSGVLIGSNTDQITLGAARHLTRVWGVHGNFGYAKNRTLATQAGVQGSDYGSYFVGGGLDRPIGRNVNFSLAYTAEIQQTNPTVCTTPGCNTSFTQNIVTINFQWHTNPFALQ
jgi:hypothetical protein